MTINAPAAVLLLMYQAVGEEQGVPAAQLTGTIQNDVLKEYIARGTYIYPPRPSLRLVADTFAYCRNELPRWNTISISGYHMAEAGATPVQEIAFTLANAREYVRAALASGLGVDEFGPRLSFFFVARTTLLEEVAKFRAARRLWAGIMRDEFRAKDPRSQMLRFHTQTAGVQLTAQQPEVNLIRVSLQALGAVLGGTQSLHTNSYDEALALPSAKAARLALRTQQVIAYESDLTATVDPFAGSYAIESMTDDIADAARELMDRVEDMGGAVAAIERGFQKAEIEEAAYRVAREIDEGERVVVGVNRFTTDGEEPYQPLRVDPTSRPNRPGWPGSANSVTLPHSPAQLRHSNRPPPGPETCFTRSATRSVRARPWARSAMHCGKYGVSTSPEKSDRLTIPGPEAAMVIEWNPSRGATLGVEWEVQLIDAETKMLRQEAGKLLAELPVPGDMGEHPQIRHELMQSTLEVVTGICSTVSEAKADLASTIRDLQRMAAGHGILLACAGTHPVSDWRDATMAPIQRYAELVEKIHRAALRPRHGSRRGRNRGSNLPDER